MIINLNGNDWKVAGYIKNQWRLGKSMEIGSDLSASIHKVSATVPGAVQLDLLEAGLLDDPNYGLNSVKGEWVNNREWIYEKEFAMPENINGDNYILCFDGLDYCGEIYLNNIRIGEFSGMFLPVELDITGGWILCLAACQEQPILGPQGTVVDPVGGIEQAFWPVECQWR